jgi:hypothetical protein
LKNNIARPASPQNPLGATRTGHKNKQARLAVQHESELHYDENKIFNCYRGHRCRNPAFNR